MLNKVLYDALKQAFGEVLIANENEQADIIPDPSSVSMWRLPGRNDGGRRGEQYHVNCPFCKDTRKRLYISYMSYASPVYRGQKLPPGRLAAFCQNEHCTDNPANRDYLAGVIARAMNGACVTTDMTLNTSDDKDVDPADRLSSDVTVDGIRTWVPDYEPVTADSDPAILEYLYSRRITDSEIKWLRIGCGPIRSAAGPLKHGVSWVIFPIVQNHKLVGVQARCPDRYMEEGDKMKYYFHPGCRKSSALFNIDMARMFSLGVVCEGVFDVASVGYPGVCCFGHTPSRAQLQMLATIGSGLIWIPDTDVSPTLDPIKIARGFVDRWNANGVFSKGAHVVILPGKDAGEMTREEVWQAIFEQVSDVMKEYLNRTIFPKLFN